MILHSLLRSWDQFTRKKLKLAYFSIAAENGPVGTMPINPCYSTTCGQIGAKKPLLMTVFFVQKRL